MQARRIARELALLGMSQLPTKLDKLERQTLEDLLAAAVRSLSAEAKDSLEAASDELKRGSNRLVDSETLATDVNSAKVMVEDAITLTQTAINRLGSVVELPAFIQTTNQAEVKGFAMELLTNTVKNMSEIDALLSQSMVAWQLNRVPRIDRDILRLAVVELEYLGTPTQVAVNEAVEIAKRYSGPDGYRFINGVLRRVVDRAKQPQAPSPSESPVPSKPSND